MAAPVTREAPINEKKLAQINIGNDYADKISNSAGKIVHIVAKFSPPTTEGAAYLRGYYADGGSLSWDKNLPNKAPACSNGKAEFWVSVAPEHINETIEFKVIWIAKDGTTYWEKGTNFACNLNQYRNIVPLKVKDLNF